MRVLMLNNEFPPRGGGTATVTQSLLDELSKEPNVEIDLVTSGTSLRLRSSRVGNVRIISLPVPCSCLHHTSNLELFLYAAEALLASIVLHIRNRYDVCLTFCTLPAGAVGFVLKKVAGVPYIVRISGPDLPGFEKRYATETAFFRPILRAIWRASAAVVVKCRQEGSVVTKEAQVEPVLIHNAVDTSAFSRESGSTKGLSMICVGRLIARKRQRDLIEAVEALRGQGKDVQLRLVGGGDDEQRLRGLVASRGLEHVVLFHGAVSRSDIPPLLAVADVFVLPSESEGMSMACLEAMAAGLPLVVSNTGGVDTLVADGQNGFVHDVGDVASLTRHLALLHDKPELRKKLGDASYWRATELTWKKTAKRYLNLMQQLAR